MKRICGVIFALAMTLALVACASDSAEVSNSSEPSVSTQAPTPRMNTVTIFTIDPVNMSIVPTQVKKIEDDNSVELIADLVLKNLEDDEIGISEVVERNEPL